MGNSIKSSSLPPSSPEPDAPPTNQGVPYAEYAPYVTPVKLAAVRTFKKNAYTLHIFLRVIALITSAVATLLHAWGTDTAVSGGLVVGVVNIMVVGLSSLFDNYKDVSISYHMLTHYSQTRADMPMYVLWDALDMSVCGYNPLSDVEMGDTTKQKAGTTRKFKLLDAL